MKQLRCIDVSEEVFNTILYYYECQVEICDVEDYIYGYKPKNVIKFNGKDTLICREYLLSRWMEECTEWKQIIVRKVENAPAQIQASLSGSNAWNYIYYKVLRKQYSDDEIKHILVSHEAEEADIYHFQPTSWLEFYKIEKVENCHYYDINSAYCDALCEMFPKCKEMLNKMYLARKDKPINKKYFNFFCGMLCRKGYRKTFNWITCRTHAKLIDKIDFTDGCLLYANTDGFIIYNPKNTLSNSKTLGEFKEEYSGTMYFYMEPNYWVMQYGNEIKGSALQEVRKYINLAENKVVHYQCKLHKTLKYKYADNMQEEILCKEK